MNNSGINFMNKYFKTIASTMALFALILSAYSLSVVTVTAQTDNTTTTELYESSSSSDFHTECTLSTSRNLVTIGDNITLNWVTSGFSDIKINGESVSEDSGSKTVENLRTDSAFILEAISTNGSKCFQEVYVACEPPEVPKECELLVEKTVNASSAVPGQELTYTIKVKNVGEADCTGGGVKIEDVIDLNVTYISHTYTSNFDAGYGSDPVYTSSDRTLHFNGNTLTPGESGSVVWFGVVNKPTQCGDFEVKNQAKATAEELNNFQTWAYSNTVKTAIDYDCVVTVCNEWDAKAKLLANEPDTFTVEFTNPTDCEIAVGATSYRVPVDEDGELCGWQNHNLDCQVRHDYEDIILQPKSIQTVIVGKPTKCFQLDWYFGKSVETFDYSGGPTHSYVGRLIDAVLTASVADCANIPEDKKATVVAEKIVCTNESQLPNYGAGGPNMTVNTAADWVANNDSCSLVPGWEFEWTDSQSSDPGDTLIGRAGSPWHAFGPTDVNGKTSVEINIDSLTNNRVWLREVLKAGYIPFTHGLSGGTNVDDVSAEFYCDADVINYDNLDYINGLADGQTYHCVAWNSLVPDVVTPPSCDSFTATPNTIMVGASSTLTWKTLNSVQVFLNNGIGEVGLNDSISVSPLADIIYQLTVIGAEDKTDTCEVPVTVSEKPVPVCEFFTATPNSLPVGGGNVVFDWKTVSATSVSIAPTIGSVGLVGSSSLNVTTGTTFVMTVVDVDGAEVSCQAPVVVADPDPFTCENNVSFTASDTSIVRGNNSLLTWSTTGVDTVSIGTINATALSGSQSVAPSDDITYTLIATKGSDSVSCPVSVVVSSGGGGGGSSSPRCDLTISDTKIKVGEEIRIKWDTSNASEVTLTDDRGKVLFTTDKYLASEKRQYFDGSIKLKTTRNTEYTLLAERGSRDTECEVKVRVEDTTVVLQTRDQQPLVAGISLSQVPYTGFEAGPFMTMMFYALLIAWAFYVAYVISVRNRPALVPVIISSEKDNNKAATKKVGEEFPDLFVASAAPIARPQTIPENLPTQQSVVSSVSKVQSAVSNNHLATDEEVTDLENIAHTQQALLSSDAVRYFISTTSNKAERTELLNKIVADAKKHYPLEDGWIVINESRMQNLCETCQVNNVAAEKITFTPTVIPEGSGSLAEAIVTGNIVAAYEMIGNRPMFALADAASDLDSVYRNRRGGSEIVSELLTEETKKLSDEKVKNMIDALTGAIDGTYTDEASAVKMAIMKAVKETV